MQPAIKTSNRQITTHQDMWTDIDSMCKAVQDADAFDKHDQANPMAERDVTTSAEQPGIQDCFSESSLRQVVF